jgi:hypothetical protein
MALGRNAEAAEALEAFLATPAAREVEPGEAEGVRGDAHFRMFAAYRLAAAGDADAAIRMIEDAYHERAFGLVLPDLLVGAVPARGAPPPRSGSLLVRPTGPLSSCFLYGRVSGREWRLARRAAFGASHLARSVPPPAWSATKEETVSTRITTVMHGAIAAAIAALLFVACDAHPTEQNAGPTWPSFASARGNPVACLAKKSLSDRLEFASADRAGKNLGRPDDWSRQLSAFDRGARMRTLEPTTRQGFLDFVSRQGAAWTPADQAHWGTLADRLSDAVAGLNLKMPHVFMVTTTGLEEFNAAYVRNKSIVLPRERAALDGPVAGDDRRDFFLLAHELFHLLSEENPARRHELYALLGFQRFAKFEYPGDLEEGRLSNPGAHWYEHALAVQTETGTADVVPIIQTTVPLEEVIQLPTSGPPAIFGVLDIVLLPVDTGTGQVLRDASGNLITHGFGDTDWVPQMLRNSNYIIHPEELMADNFALLMEWRSTGILPSATPAGFPVNDVGLLEAIQDVLTAGCVG